jgi:hypothetical protein
VDNARAKTDNGASTDSDIASKRGAWGYVSEVLKHAVVINARSRIDDAVATNPRPRVDDRAGHHHGSSADDDVSRDLRRGVDRGGELTISKRDTLTAMIVANGDNQVATRIRLARCGEDGQAQQSGLLRIIVQYGRRRATARDKNVRYDLGMATCSDQVDRHALSHRRSVLSHRDVTCSAHSLRGLSRAQPVCQSQFVIFGTVSATKCRPLADQTGCLATGQTAHAP